MTTEIEKQFFDTFGIETSNICEYAKYGYDGTEGTWYFCSKNQEECWTYPSDTTCKDKRISYPQITDRILLELICIAMDITDFGASTVEDLKEVVLKVLISEMKYENPKELRHQVQAVFEEG